MSETKTAEEIRIKWIRHTPLMKLDECVDNAMQEYANQQNKELQRQLDGLEWKCDAFISEYKDLQSQYTQIKDAADEIAYSDPDSEEYVKAINKYEQLTQKQK